MTKIYFKFIYFSKFISKLQWSLFTELDKSFVSLQKNVHGFHRIICYWFLCNYCVTWSKECLPNAFFRQTALQYIKLWRQLSKFHRLRMFLICCQNYMIMKASRIMKYRLISSYYCITGVRIFPSMLYKCKILRFVSHNYWNICHFIRYGLPENISQQQEESSFDTVRSLSSFIFLIWEYSDSHFTPHFWTLGVCFFVCLFFQQKC